MKERWLTLTAVALGVSQVALILLSWIISAVAPGISMRSLLSSGGIRWFLGHFVDNMLTPLLAWILLLALLWGALNKSGIMALLPFRRHRPTLTYRQRMAIRFVLLELCMFLLAIALLTLLPHAILLSVTGSLFPSSFSQAIVPLLTLIGITCSISASSAAMPPCLRPYASASPEPALSWLGPSPSTFFSYNYIALLSTYSLPKHPDTII